MASAMMTWPGGGQRPATAAGHWTDEGACREPGADPELFFPVSEAGRATRRQVAEAKAVCARCPVMEECRDWAVEAGEPEGIWGGTTPEERRHLRRRLPRVA